MVSRLPNEWWSAFFVLDFGADDIVEGIYLEAVSARRMFIMEVCHIVVGEGSI